MVPQLDDLGIDVPEISQIGIVVRDLEEAMESYATLGIEPWDVFRCEPPEEQTLSSEVPEGEKLSQLTNRTYFGSDGDFAMRLAFSDVGGTQMELVEPLKGTSLFTDHLAEHGQGIQHVGCFAYEDTYSIVETFENAGMSVIQSGKITYKDRESEWWYFDTEERLNGVIFETATGSIQPT